MPRKQRYVRMKRKAGGGFVRLTKGGAILEKKKIKKFLEGAYDYVKSKAGDQIMSALDSGKQALGNLVHASKEAIFNEINKKIGNMSFIPKSGGGVKRMY